MYELYIGNKNYSSWSLRPWLLMRELAIPFKENLIPFTPGGSWEHYRDFSPTGRVPCLRDGDAVVWDSLGISEYLAERHAGVWPSDSTARAWARCAAAEMHSGFNQLRGLCSMNCGVRVRLRELPQGLKSDIERVRELWNEGLARFGGPYLAGPSFSAADAFFAPVAFRVQTYGLELDQAATAYAGRLRDLPAMVSWYRDGLAELWREADHEAEMLVLGELVEDLRAPAK